MRNNEILGVVDNEVRKFITEGYVMEHDNFKFRQELTNSSFYNFKNFSNDFDVDISESDIFVNWRIGFWLNDNGIENFLVKVDSVEGSYKVMLFNKQTDEVEQENDKNIADEPWKFQIYEAMLKLNDTLYIKSLDFDFQTKICTVTFTDPDNQI